MSYFFRNQMKNKTLEISGYNEVPEEDDLQIQEWTILSLGYHNIELEKDLSHPEGKCYVKGFQFGKSFRCVA